MGSLTIKVTQIFLLTKYFNVPQISQIYTDLETCSVFEEVKNLCKSGKSVGHKKEGVSKVGNPLQAHLFPFPLNIESYTLFPSFGKTTVGLKVLASSKSMMA